MRSEVPVPQPGESSSERLIKVDAMLRTLLELRVRDASTELIDLELEILKIRARLVAPAGERQLV